MHWATVGCKVLVIEADSAGGSLSRSVGLNSMLGSASLLTDKLAINTENLLSVSHNVLCNDMYIMPAPSNPLGVMHVMRAFAHNGQKLRNISESDIALIIDGGRMDGGRFTGNSDFARLLAWAAGVTIVSRSGNPDSVPMRSQEIPIAHSSMGPPAMCSVTIGQSVVGGEQWQSDYGLTFCGAIELIEDTASDLSAFSERHKRKYKKWYRSLSQVGDHLFQYAQPNAQPTLQNPALQSPMYSAHSQHSQQSQPRQYDQYGQPGQYGQHDQSYSVQGGPQYSQYGQNEQHGQYSQYSGYEQQGQMGGYDQYGQPLQNPVSAFPAPASSANMSSKPDESSKPESSGKQTFRAALSQKLRFGSKQASKDDPSSWSPPDENWTPPRTRRNKANRSMVSGDWTQAWDQARNNNHSSF